MIRRVVISAALLLSCAPQAEQPQHPDHEPHAQHEPHAKHEPHEHAQHEAHAAHEAQAHHGPLVHTFEDAERWSKRFDDPERAASQKPAEVVAAMAVAPGMTVADLGTGTGYFLPFLSPAVGDSGRVLALDIETGMIEFVTRRAQREKLANVVPRLVTVDDPKLEPGSVDRILVVNTWHHIPNRSAYVHKLVSALKPGGSVWVVDFTLETERGPPKKHRLAPDIVMAELKAGGLDTRLDTQLLVDQYIAIGSKAQSD